MCRDIVDGHDDGLCHLWVRIVSLSLQLIHILDEEEIDVRGVAVEREIEGEFPSS